MSSSTTNKDVFRPPLFSFKNGPLKRLPFNKRPQFSLLDFPAEIRNVIYHFAVVVPFVIRNDDTSYKNDRKRRDRISACFTFMGTCRQIYEEASPVFWGGNTFLLQARMVETDAPFSLGFRPFTLHPTAILDEVLSPTNAWHVNVGVRSHKRRNQIRKVVWNYASDNDPALRHAKRWRLSNRAWLNLGGRFLQNVTELTIMFDDFTSNLARFPRPENVEAYAERLWELTGAQDDREEFVELVQLISRGLRTSTLAHILFFTRRAMPSIRTVRIGAWVDEEEHVPGKLLSQDGDFFSEISAKTEHWDRSCEYAGVRGIPRETYSVDSECPHDPVEDRDDMDRMLELDDELRYEIYKNGEPQPGEFGMLGVLYDPDCEEGEDQHDMDES
ncbi:hypothetical protein PRZ48_006464 [Zasmidium cellare]|uniref:Uncharacterized protein n=1 Tax=Zasmidium cellare TaxID=395010 RepID=A0ABR0ENF6_ZASCE|nr:hypothetical protein PRZ48_006464 [Zasmidium cellare]